MLQILFAVTSFLVPLFAFSLAFLCFLRNHKSNVVILYFLQTIFVGIWGLGLFLLFIVKNESQAIRCNYILYFGATLIPILFFHFVSAFLYRIKQDKLLIIVGYILAVFFLILIFYPPLLISGASPKTGFNFWVDPGILYIPFVIYFWLYVLVSIYLLIKRYKCSEGIIKRRLFYIILAAIVGFGGGGTNFLPQLFGIFPLGGFITFLYPIFITYGIFFKKY